MFDLPLGEIRDAADAAMSTIDADPTRIGELGDADLTSVAVHLKTQLPIFEHMLVALCGNAEQANAALQRALAYSKGKLAKLVRAGHVAVTTHGNPSVGQLAALVINSQVGVGAVQVEQERRQALRAGRMN